MEERLRTISANLIVQSSNEIQSEGNMQVEQTLEFHDEDSGDIQDMSVTPMRYEIQDSVTEADLNSFFNRPVLIDTHIYNATDVQGFNYGINPWHSYFNSVSIKKKLENYGFIRCNLHLKFVVNATPFVYGSIRACYRPLPNFTPERFTPDVVERAELIPYSQYPGTWIDPSKSQGGEMVLPFFYQRNFVRATKASDFIDLGRLNFVNYTQMQSANGDPDFSFTVQTYAWAENVVLSAPTLGLAMQGEDEYGLGVISKPASTVARFASYLQDIPIIGPFAKATEIGASAVSGIAKLFGWTNVPVLEDTHPYRSTPFPQMASTELGYPVEKLTIDSKNELTVDPQSIGLPPTDELSIQNIVSKQSFLTIADWQTNHLENRPLFTSRVTPFLGRAQTVTANHGKMWFTPLSVVSTLFDNWRGDIIFTLKVVCSQYHKGRLRITYDPTNSSVQTNPNTESMAFSTILDLGESTEVEMRIPYQQALSWLRVEGDLRVNNFTTSSTPVVSRNDLTDNGLLSVKVLTKLSAPVGAAGVSMLVFVRGAENLEFANPIEPSNAGYLSSFAMQGVNEYSEVHAEKTSLGKTSDELLIERNIVNFGESIVSLRPLLRRSNLVDANVLGSDPTPPPTGSIRSLRVDQTKFPPFYGYDPDGVNTALKILTAGSANFNYTNDTPWHIISQCFIAQRGSTHWHYNVMINGHSQQWSASSLSVNRLHEGASNASLTVRTGSLLPKNVMTRYYLNELGNSAAGTALTNQETQSGLSFACPNYTPFKFQSTSPENATRPPTAYNKVDGSDREWFRVQAYYPFDSVPSRSMVHRYFSVGTDYSLYFFINAPVLTTMVTVPEGAS